MPTRVIAVIQPGHLENKKECLSIAFVSKEDSPTASERMLVSQVLKRLSDDDSFPKMDSLNVNSVE